MSEHTKGPWTLAAPRYVVVNGQMETRLDVRATGETFATLVIPEHERMEEPTVAKLRLLLEAPDLLEALEGLAQSVEKSSEYEDYCPHCDEHPGGDWDHEDDCPLVAARAAIAKARGTR